jgi:hypothetical protein
VFFLSIYKAVHAEPERAERDGYQVTKYATTLDATFFQVLPSWFEARSLEATTSEFYSTFECGIPAGGTSLAQIDVFIDWGSNSSTQEGDQRSASCKVEITVKRSGFDWIAFCKRIKVAFMPCHYWNPYVSAHRTYRLFHLARLLVF